jgi:hypothetical protein
MDESELIAKAREWGARIASKQHCLSSPLPLAGEGLGERARKH